MNLIMKNKVIFDTKGCRTPGNILDIVYKETKFEVDLFGDRVNNIYNNKGKFEYQDEGLGYYAFGDEDLPFQAIRAGLHFWAFPPKSNCRQCETQGREPSLTTNIKNIMEAMKESHEEVKGAITITVNEPLVNECNAFDIDHRRALIVMAQYCTHTFLFEHIHFMKPTPQSEGPCCLTQSTRPSGDKLLVCFVSNKSSYGNFDKSKCKIFKMNPPGKDQYSLSTQLTRHGHTKGKIHKKSFVRLDVDQTVLGSGDEHTNIYNYSTSTTAPKTSRKTPQAFKPSSPPLGGHHFTHDGHL